MNMIRQRSTAMFASAVLVGLALLTAACGSNGGDNASASPAVTKSDKTATVAVASSDLGNILVDSQGRTLYLFGADTGTKSACSGACAVNWPPLVVSGT